MAQLFAVFPIRGFSTKATTELHFNWINYRIFHCLIILFGVTIMAVLSIVWIMSMATSDITVKKLGKCL